VTFGQTIAPTKYMQEIGNRYKLPELAVNFSAAINRAFEIELRLKAKKRKTKSKLAAEKRLIVASQQAQGEAEKTAKTPSNRDLVAKRELLRYKIRQYDAELDSIRNYEIGARLLAIQTERVFAAKDAQDMEDIVMILALDEA